MMDLLGITTLRPGRNGSNTNSPHAVNYDEAKANPFPNLPDPLTLKNGGKVTTAESWWNQRHPEIVEDFDHEIYGRVPKETPKVNWEITRTTRETNAPGGTNSPPRGGGFGAGNGPTWQQQCLAKGWGYAVLTPISVQADNGAGLTQGIIGLCNKGQARKLDDWGALRAWAWGASRALDHFETDKAVDAKRIGLEGHSRYGKATLVAMAYDSRFAAAYVSSSGEGGRKTSSARLG